MKTLLALCLVALVAATTGGGLGFVGAVHAQAAETSGEQTADTGGQCVYVAQALHNTVPFAVPAASPTPCSSDCSAVVPSFSSEQTGQSASQSGQASALLQARLEALQLPPPRA